MDSFSVEEWEIWHSYSTYFKAHIRDLEKVARLLVDLEVADCSVMSDGKTFCRTNDGVTSGRTVVEVSGNLKQASINFESSNQEKVNLTPYARETWLAASQFLCGEERQFTSGLELPTAHLRAFLKPIELVKNAERISSLYPMIVLYQSGVLIIEFRIISPDRSIELSDFIKNYINIHQYNYDYAIVPTAICTLATEAYHTYLNPKTKLSKRISLLKDKKNHEKVFNALAKKVDFGDFEFEMAPLTSRDGKETITSIAHTLFGIVGLLIGKPISSFSYLLKGVPDLPKLGNFWVSKPHIHLIRHSNQQDEASSNENLHKESFGRILSFIPKGSGNFLNFVPINSRSLDDFSAYITSTATLWVWSKKALEEHRRWIDLNRGNLIYERQVQVELLEYGFMLHKSLVKKSTELKNFPELLATRRDLVDLKSKILEAAPYGEVRDLLIKGWEEMNLAAVQGQISENLSILESEIKFLDSKQSDNFRIFLTAFGLIASASFTKSIVSPLWKVSNLWLPMDESRAELFLVLISAVLVVFFIIGLRRFIYR